jgi:hypothetical protein
MEVIKCVILLHIYHGLLRKMQLYFIVGSEGLKNTQRDIFHIFSIVKISIT